MEAIVSRLAAPSSLDCKLKHVKGAQWTGIVTTIAVEMRKSNMVEAVVCVQSDPEDRLSPRPVLARFITFPYVVYLRPLSFKSRFRLWIIFWCYFELNSLVMFHFLRTPEEVLAETGALRSVEQHLDLEKLYVLGTNCVDNGTCEGLDKFLKSASKEPETVLHYEFMQDYKVQLKHLDGHIEESVAYGRSSAPKDCRVSGWLQGKGHETLVEAKKMQLLTELTYDLDRSNAHTFNILNLSHSGLVDTVRLDFTSNHGSNSHTCIHRFRVHGHAPEPVSVVETEP